MSETNMIVSYTRNIRMQPSKSRLIVKFIKNNFINKKKNKPNYIMNMLDLCRSKKNASFIKKSINNGINIAKTKGLEEDKLVVSNIIIEEGRKLKRLHCRARGKSAKILRRYSHIKTEMEIV